MTAPRRANLVEAHAHIAAYGESLAMPDLSACRSVGECLEMVRLERERATGPRPWIRMLGARIEAWDERRWPTLAELDRAAAGVPCVILSFDHHAAAANSLAMAAAGLRPGVPVPPNAVVCVDTRDQPTGLLLEHAASAAWNAAPEPSMAEREAHVHAALARLAALGFVEVHDLLSQDWLGPALGRLERAGHLTVRVHLYPPVARIEAIAAGRAQWESDAIRLAGAKAFADGTINSRTALMLHDYADPLPGLPRGKAMMSPADLDAAISLTRRLGIALAVHAIGDGAVRSVLDAVSRATDRCSERSVPPAHGRTDRAEPRSVARIRIEHAELIDAADIPRFAQLGVGCSVQPCHLLTDIEALRRYLPYRLDRVLPLRDLIDSGCRPGELLRFGSDVPIVRPDPRDSIQAAVHRRREGMPQGDAVAWKQRITEAEAWAAFAARG